MCRQLTVSSSDTQAAVDSRQRVEDLVAEAEELVRLAKIEAERMIDVARRDTTAKAERLVALAEELRVAAEIEGAEIRAEAEALRARARQDADQILSHARTTHDEIVARANEIAPEAPGDAGARDEADRILRVAHAEAEARSAEIMEASRRRTEAMEAEGRRRVEEMGRTYRQLQRQMRDEEVAVRIRIGELEERLGRMTAPTPSTPMPQGATPSPPVSPPSPETQDGQYPWSIRAHMTEEAEDPDVLKALKAFRRRT